MSSRLHTALARIRTFFDTGNLFRAVLALILAFSLWAWVTAESDPETSRTISQVVVRTENGPAGLEVVGQIPVVDVTVQGPRSRVQQITASSLEARIDLGEVEQAGTVTVPVVVQAPEDVRVRRVEPRRITVTLDRIVSRDGVPVTPTQPTNLPPNLEVRSVTPTPNMVRISGPQANVDRVAAVRVDVSIEGRSASYTDTVPAVPVDAANQPVPNVTVDPARISIAIDLEVRGQIRKVIPEVIGTDALAAGYELARPPTVVPTDEIVVDGPSDQVAEVLYLTTEPIDVTGWSTSEVVRDVRLDLSQLPPDVIVERQTVHVSIQIRKQSYRQQITNVPIQTVNARPGTTATVSPAIATITIEGTRSVVEGLLVSDVDVVVDLGSAGPGTYQLRARVILPATVRLIDLEPQRVTVTVVEAPVPSPTSSVPVPASTAAPTPSDP